VLRNDRVFRSEWFRRSALVEFVVEMMRRARTDEELLGLIERR